MMNSDSSQVRERVGEEEWDVRCDLAAAYQVFAMFGWTHLIHTHITAKVPGDKDHFLINRLGLLWEEITASSLVKVDADGGIIDHGSTESTINPAGFKIHSAIHLSERAAIGSRTFMCGSECCGQPEEGTDPRSFRIFHGYRWYFLS